MKQNVFVIVPCYNEAESILAVLRRVRTAMPEAHIVAVNDGSADHTLQLLRSFEDSAFTVLDLPFNCGIGVAVQTGLLYAVRHGAEYAVKFDGDGQHPADAIPALLAPIIAGGADFTTGSRFLVKNDGFQSTAMRRVGIRFFYGLSWLLTGVALTDTTSGFRAYGRGALEFAAKYYPAFDYPEPEESILMLRNRFRVREIPCMMLERQGGSSSIRPHKAVYYMLKVGFAMVMERVRPPKKGRVLCS